MATGQLSPHGRGFGFDQADGVGQYAVGNRLRKYNTSNLSLGAAIPEEANNGNTTKSKTSRSGRLGNLQRAFGGGSFGTQHRRQGTQATTAGSVSRPASLAKRITVFLHPHTHNHNETRTSDHNHADPSLPLDNHHSHSVATPSEFQRSPLTHPNCQWLGCISHQYLYNSDPHKVNSPLHLTSECIPVIRSIAMVVFHIVEKLERVEKLYSMKHTLLPA
ncbi:hypothetical protein MJO28_010043 [Puccinia striiformis f. sp. tritici]|uniref:Uncharacterized protein n=2 Tax=Puccinia striiformis TaxID=27350 RepID=A0A2S4VQN9_9BASI|nr:hypothetical protein MJO28_010043 [Puccinia striiformis f. sp. tritici]POW11867.1 hypothetical protein PSTT_04950 [Puccinia striiformis]